MEPKVTLRTMEDDKEEERQPLNAMVTENLKNIIIRKIYRDVEKNVAGQRKGGSTVFHQYLAALGPITAGLSSGMSAGYSAILLPQLAAEDTEIVITKSEGSWIASMLALPLIFGCLASGYVMDRFGRKLGHILTCVPFTLGWLVLAFAPDVPALYAGRFLTGFCIGVISPMCQVYIAETSDPENRGILLSGAPLTVAVGIFLSHVLGTFFTWRVTAGICGIPPLVCVLLLVFALESPTWLLQKERFDAAEKAFRWFRGDSEEATKEFNGLLTKSKDPEDGAPAGRTSRLGLCLRSSFLKPFAVLNFFFLVQQFSGVNAVAFYSISILRDVLSTMNEYVATILIDVVRCVMSVVAILLLKRFGRKTLSVASAVGTALSLFFLALYLGFVDVERAASGGDPVNATLPSNYTGEEPDLPPEGGFRAVVTYLPMVFLVSYICFVSVGLVPIPWVLTGELFSKELRGIGSGGTSSFGFLCYFAVVKLTPDLFELLGTHGTFCLFGVVSILGSVVLGLFLPETKGKTLTEIEAFYAKKKKQQQQQQQTGASPEQNGGGSVRD